MKTLAGYVTAFDLAATSCHEVHSPQQ